MILKGDCIQVMKAMKPNSVDAIVTDPPYNLHFMGKDWDKDLLHEKWLTEAYRVLKPGGSMLVMGGTRTSHRLACAVEDSGFIIKDTLMWLYGSGFPKAQDLGKMIDKRMGAKRKVVGKKSQSVISEEWRKKEGRTDRLNNEFLDISIPSTDLAKYWDGFKVGGIKPAYEPIIWAVKPPEGSYMDNVLKWGVGAVNVDECRIEGVSWKFKHTEKTSRQAGIMGKVTGARKGEVESHSKGRFPANVILSHHPECVQVGVKKVKSGTHGKAQGGFNPTGKTIYGKGNPSADVSGGYNNEQVESWDCHTDCPIRLLDEQSGVSKSSGGYPKNLYNDRIPFKGSICETTGGLGDTGGASRFFYCAKASRGERNAGLEGMEENRTNDFLADKEGPDRTGKPTYQTNNHPTVKPIKLFEYLIKLVTREGQIVLDPFIGSGTTAIAAHNTGRKCIGIEKEDEYLEIAKRRISYWQNQPKQNSLNLGG